MHQQSIIDNITFNQLTPLNQIYSFHYLLIWLMVSYQLQIFALQLYLLSFLPNSIQQYLILVVSFIIQMNSSPQYLNYEYSQTQLAPQNTDYFHSVKNTVTELQLQVKHIDHFAQQRQVKYRKSMTLYKKHLQKERALLDKNKRHCEMRDQWYRQQIRNSWQTAIRNRNLVLRTLARTNLVKRDADQWIARIDDDVWQGQLLKQFVRNQDHLQGSQNNRQNNINESELKGSMLIDKYNQILKQYQHKL